MKKNLIKAVNVAVALTLSVGFASCSDSEDEPAAGGTGSSPEQVNENAIVASITQYNSSGRINKVYEFEYDENNNITAWTESYGYTPYYYVIKKDKNTIAVVEINEKGDSTSYGNYEYKNGFITKTCFGKTLTYENDKLVKGAFSSITWDGDNISQIICSGDKHEYIYNELLNNASINFNAFEDYNMSCMIDDEDGEEFVAFGLAAGTRTKNLISEIEVGYNTETGYVGPLKEVYTYETDSLNRVTKITVTKDARVYGGSLYVKVYEITYR